MSPRRKAFSADWNPGDLILDLYEVEGLLGEGGMGRVYKVHHRGWRVTLAVKTPRPETLRHVGNEAFTREAETWVGLGIHRHVVCCHYVRTIDGVPRAFAEWVAGGSLSSWIADRRLYAGVPTVSLKRILDVAIQFSWGLEYAHQQGLVHHDVKPANLMMTLQGVAKVTDFGLAVAGVASGSVGERSATVAKELTGYFGITRAYCSPEQAEVAAQIAAGVPPGSRTALTMRTDIWSWAISILEMFCGERPCDDGQAAGAALESLLEFGSNDAEIPVLPAALTDLLRRCFEFDPARRPATMAEVGHTLIEIYQEQFSECYSREKPESVGQTADTRNNRAVSLMDLARDAEAERHWQAALLSDPQHLPSLYNYGLVLWRKGRMMPDALLRNIEGARRSGSSPTLVDQLTAEVHLECGNYRDAEVLLDGLLESAEGSDEIEHLVRFAKAHARPKCSGVVGRQEGSVTDVALNTSGTLALAGSRDGTTGLWDLDAATCLRVFRTTTAVRAVALGRDGSIAITGHDDGLIRVWDATTGASIRSFGPGLDYAVQAFATTPDSRRLLSGHSHGAISLWDIASGSKIWSESHQVSDRVTTITILGSGALGLVAGIDRAAGAEADHLLSLWDLAARKRVRTLKAGHVSAACADVSGRFGASVGAGKVIRIWDLRSGSLLRSLEGDSPKINAIAMSPSGRRILACEEGQIRIWEASGRCLRLLKTGPESVSSIRFDPKGGFAVSGATDGTLKRWEIGGDEDRPYVARMILSRPQDTDSALSVQKAYEREIAMAVNAHARRAWRTSCEHVRRARALPGFGRDEVALNLWSSLSSQLRLGSLQGAWLDGSASVGALLNRSALSHDGTRVALACDDGRVRIVLLPSGRPIGECWRHAAPISAVGPCGNVSWVAGAEDGALVLCVASPTAVQFGGGDPVDFSAEFSAEGIASLAAHRVRLLVPPGGSAIRDVKATRLGDFVATGHQDGSVCLWSTTAAIPSHSIRGPGPVNSVWVSADAARVAFAGQSGCMSIWSTRDVPLGGPVTCSGRHDSGIVSLAVDLGGHTAVSAGNDGTLGVWDLSNARFMRTIAAHRMGVTAVAITDDGRFCLSGGEDNMCRLWDIESGSQVHAFDRFSHSLVSVSLGQGGSAACAAAITGEVRRWQLDWDLHSDNINGASAHETRP
jgi:WD40 repeat protein/serine/threonine protein kinase